MRTERVALVTGAARGIGAATALRLARDGYLVVAFDACAGETQDVPYALATHDDMDRVIDAGQGRVVPIIGDARNVDDLRRAVTVATESWGRLDAVVAGAAIMLGGQPQWETSPAVLEQLWDADLMSVWNTAQASVPVLLVQPERTGRFVALASAAGHQGLYSLSAYTTVKHAVIGLVRGLAADLTGTGVTAVAVSPGSTDTAMLRATARVYGTSIDELVTHQSLGRVLTPEEIAATIALCCSPEGATLNGSVIHADGGFGG